MYCPSTYLDHVPHVLGTYSKNFIINAKTGDNAAMNDFSEFCEKIYL